jgi:hypothetical protein
MLLFLLSIYLLTGTLHSMDDTAELRLQIGALFFVAAVFLSYFMIKRERFETRVKRHARGKAR